LHGRGETVRLLLEKDADMDVTAKYGLSALMLAVINRHTEIAKQLVDAGANTRMRGSGAPGFAGKTAHQLAEHGGLTDLAAYIARADGLDPRSK
jgi:ankyrin repeat protein